MTTGLTTLAVPCRTDEPALARTLAAGLASWRAAAGNALEVLVCLNGPPREEPLAAVRAFASAAGAPLAVVDLDAGPAALPAPETPVAVAVLQTARAGKPQAWNALRRHARGALAVFMDADVACAPNAFGRLLAALAATPEAVLASGRTTCAARPGAFEAIMAAPYGVDFPNLSPQLYAARVAALPAALPEDLLDQEHWLELTVGHRAIVRCPDVRVEVRLPATLGDFFRQRIRIEMAKVQLAREYPGLAARGAPQPGAAVAVRSLGAAGSARLAAYLVLRTLAHAVAWWRYRKGATAGVWRQAVSTKRWDAA